LVRQIAPVVVIGSVGPGEDQLASVDGDEKVAGQLLAECMLRRGYRQCAVLMGELWRPGDNHFVEGIQQTLEAANLSVGALRVLSLRRDARMLRQQVRELLATRAEPLALICQGVSFAQWLRDFWENDPQLPWDRVGIAYHADTEQPDRPLPYPFTFQRLSTIDMSAMAGEMVLQLGSKGELPQRHVLLPMELCEPT
jgi:DNA-binding LacI/PurR family transcriptional regulator